MLKLLSQYSKNRTAWFLLFLSTILFELTALFFQHVLDLPPCTLCIYQRVAILGIAAASLVAFFSPQNIITRVLGISIWLYSAYIGFSLAYQQARLQFAPLLTDTCSINVQFPEWLPLNYWFPSIFNAYGYCADKIWSFLTIEMSQWMIIIFSCYFIVGSLVLFANLFYPNKKFIVIEANRRDF
ncbi:disulfide bond formation protein DsbB [Orbus sturtevantii]|uniref:disulfide bond formation protein DsbB n=1 Tax=Orbus sturtevantii TaxID=3074109 RepID=UPI00370D4F0E